MGGGLGQLVQFAATLIHEPAFVVLDEPFSGLDPLNVRCMKGVWLTPSSSTVIIQIDTQ